MQVWLLFESQPVELVTAQEQHHELRAARVQRPVLLRGELVDVGAHVFREVPQVHGLLLLVVGLAGLQYRGQRHLRVHEHHPVASEVDAHVGTKTSAVGRCVGGLRLEMAVLHQARDLRYPPQAGLTPGAPHLWDAQRRLQGCRLLAHRLA